VLGVSLAVCKAGAAQKVGLKLTLAFIIEILHTSKMTCCHTFSNISSSELALSEN